LSSFDVNVTAAPPVADLVDTDAGPLLQIAVPVILPIGPGQAFHLGTVRFPMDRDSAKAFFERGLSLVEELPPPSKIEVASNLSEVEAAAERLASFKGDND
jgi:hypothetical protein